MCTVHCLDFVLDTLPSSQVRGKRVIEVGSYDANGSARAFLERSAPSEYLGVDISAGPGVDEVCGAESLIDRYGRDSFDIVVSTEMLEHVRQWRTVVSNMKGILRPGGRLILTTRSKGFEYHGWPFDFWRFSTSDMSLIFSDFADVSISDDPDAPGVFVKATKPVEFVEQPLDALALYSIVKEHRCLELTDNDLSRFALRRKMTTVRRSATSRLPDSVLSRLKTALPSLVSPPIREGAGPVIDRVHTSRDIDSWLGR